MYAVKFPSFSIKFDKPLNTQFNFLCLNGIEGSRYRLYVTVDGII